jgi:hypothetical protein
VGKRHCTFVPVTSSQETTEDQPNNLGLISLRLKQRLLRNQSLFAPFAPVNFSATRPSTLLMRAGMLGVVEALVCSSVFIVVSFYWLIGAVTPEAASAADLQGLGQVLSNKCRLTYALLLGPRLDPFD